MNVVFIECFSERKNNNRKELLTNTQKSPNIINPIILGEGKNNSKINNYDSKEVRPSITGN